ncbi:MAG TPA: NfeD family protein [Bacillota bacterium]|nr:NfeD family protein [Bacillota bacterium]
MGILELEWIGLVITGLGTLFLFGEILVNARGIFGLLGVGFMTIYFTVYMEPSSLGLIIAIYIIGIILIIIDGKVVNDGTLATLGAASMLLAVGIAADNVFAGLYAVIGVILGGGASFLFLKAFKQRDMWSKLALKDQLTKELGYISMNQDYEQLIGKNGVTLNDLRPVGTVRIEGQDYSAVTNGQWVTRDTNITVVQVDGTKILVEEVTE